MRLHKTPKSSLEMVEMRRKRVSMRSAAEKRELLGAEHRQHVPGNLGRRMNW